MATDAQAGGTMRELMARAGHRAARAALVYQHAAEERNAVLAERMDSLTGLAPVTSPGALTRGVATD